ncbi:YjgB family protein [Peribacillus sp. SCS-26]|uniref:YjgB family protein n=1 Tax=Paraperibacillus marinus TaxID=3115295 RepID=UPI0039060A2D
MLSKKPTVPIAAALFLTGSVTLTGAAFPIEPAHASVVESEDDTAQEDAVKKLHEIHDSAYHGGFPGNAESFILHKTTRTDIQDRWGPAPMPRTTDSPFDIYGANMGNPGYGFSYDKNNIVKEIRFFGTNVERGHNLGGITAAVLGRELGSADYIRSIPGTGETSYIYETGNYELQFVIGTDGTADHVNLK